uniref:Uncharacterized protein n=1 Tax=mine drainage metagenome TaxID=410659 RepID=E6QPC7_9ZZZZ
MTITIPHRSIFKDRSFLKTALAAKRGIVTIAAQVGSGRSRNAYEILSRMMSARSGAQSVAVVTTHPGEIPSHIKVREVYADLAAYEERTSTLDDFVLVDLGRPLDAHTRELLTGYARHATIIVTDQKKPVAVPPTIDISFALSAG